MLRLLESSRGFFLSYLKFKRLRLRSHLEHISPDFMISFLIQILPYFSDSVRLLIPTDRKTLLYSIVEDCSQLTVDCFQIRLRIAFSILILIHQQLILSGYCELSKSVHSCPVGLEISFKLLTILLRKNYVIQII